MTKEQIVKTLKENMPKFTGTEEEKEIKKALYIYTQLGKEKSFDERYYFGNNETKKKIYKLALQENKKNENTKRRILCVSLSDLYCKILKEFGINSIISEPEEEQGHVYPIILTKKKKAIIADIQLDLENIQTKSRLEHFEYWGDKPRKRHETCNQEAITEMLIEMGYINSKEEYKNNVIYKLKEETKTMTANETLKHILENEELYKDNAEMGVIEINKFYRGILKKVAPQYLNKKIFAFNCFRKKDNEEKEYTVCVFSEEKEERNIYLFSKKKNKFLKVELEKLKELQEQGLTLGIRSNELGSKNIKKEIEKISIKEEKRESKEEKREAKEEK